MDLWHRYTRLQHYKREKALREFREALFEALYCDKIVSWLAKYL